MHATLTIFPELDTLREGIAAATGTAPSQVKVRGRRPLESASTYPSEVVACEIGDEKLDLLCKYSADREHASFGHRSGLAYEARFYRHVLSRLPLPHARFHGTYRDPETNWIWLVIEHLTGAQPAKWTMDGVVSAARWIGQFHALCPALLSGPETSFITRYDEAYYRGWMQRTADLSAPLEDRYPWLASVCSDMWTPMDLLLEQAQTIAHGEFYVGNVLIRDDLTYPVDWESAAICAGEIDLAALTEGYDPHTTDLCIAAYCGARWPSGAPAGFPRMLDAARIYLLFRWLGERQNWTLSPRSAPAIERLRQAAIRWGLLEGRRS